jgi:inhibitor of KinA sporulation pathway (predicted exonuclease)
MTKKLDCALVIDVESTCWEREPPRGQSSEIIEIGLCVVDLQLLERCERRSIMVKPMMSEVSEFCTRLTGITPDMLADAITLAEAVRILRDQYGAADRLFASWGDYDRSQFVRNCRTYDLKYPFGPTHLNIKNLFSTALGLQRELGIDAACERLGLTMEGAHHRGVDDAWNIARIFCVLLTRIRRCSA